ncbi:MAG: DNA-processing protein DprA [Lachnospiraceae bacterium]|nr:DNA-processing protein DprA [Lachnospiraceae bacterium]
MFKTTAAENVGISREIIRKYREKYMENIKVCTLDDNNYPLRLREIENPPEKLYYKGHLPKDDVPAVAIIGARDCSEYGTYVANAFGEALASYGVNIISGMARGIDGISQVGAIRAGGRTYGVLGSGVDVCYPVKNLQLYKDIQKNGGVLSIFPPGSKPERYHFPMRNRIVAALADLILVVEAREKSGTSITVELAMGMGKEVYAVPGRLTDRLSDGCNRLIKEGAGVALSPEDVLRELSLIWEIKHPNNDKLNYNLINKLETGQGVKDEGVLKYMDTLPKSVEEIHMLRLKKEPDATLQETLTQIVLRCSTGDACQVGSGYFYKVLR